MIRRVCAKMTGPGRTPYLSARLALSTGPIGMEASTAVTTSTLLTRIKNKATKKPKPMVKIAVPNIGTNKDPNAATASGVKDKPTEVATRICPI